MSYGRPIESKAKEHASTYVMSDQLVSRLSELIILNLQFTTPQDNKGLLIVGNYGTGKSHLMSVISSVAENKDVQSLLTNDKTRNAVSSIAGRFKVIRLEIGATEMSLREIITGQLEDGLAQWGVTFQFPAADKIRENKTSFDAMMGAFVKKFPNHGLLLVVDELLDYLRSRHDQPLILDLRLPANISGLWSLWEISIVTHDDQKRRMVPLFVHDDGRTLAPTARFLWEQLCLEPWRVDDAPAATLEDKAFLAAETLAHEQCRDIYLEMRERHMRKLQLEKDKAEYSFRTRRKLLEAIGLPEVRDFRLRQLAQEQSQWTEEFERQSQVMPQLTLLLMLRVA